MTGFAGIRLIAANLILSVFASDFINQALNLIFIIIRFPELHYYHAAALF